MTDKKDYPFANIIINISHEQVDRAFGYRIPDRLRGMIDVGSCVIVPFGRGDHLRKGYVVELTDKSDYDVNKLKYINDIATKDLPAEDVFIKLAAWMRRNYGSTMYAALKTVLPAHKKQSGLKHRFISLRMDIREAREYYYECKTKHRKAQERLLEAILEDPEVRLPYELITGKMGISSAVIRALKDKCVIKVEEEDYLRNPVRDMKVTGDNLCLSNEQQAIVSRVISDYDQNIRRTYLIHGITGSGKTEVYIRMIAEIIKRGKQAIVLIPEIALTYQTLMRFYRHFGDRVSVMNSTLSPGEKYDQFERARQGLIDVMIGPRSALFTPFPGLGLIVMDEEHEGSYKSEQMPRYHARETAVALAGMLPDKASVVLGSATPSLDAYYRALTGEYVLLRLTRRLTGGTLPEVVRVDLREELRSGNRSIFSRVLREGIEERLTKGEQVMLFINRRGLAGFVSCRSCGHVFKCPHCDVSLSEHRGGKLVCHYCGYNEPVRKICPKCGSKYVSSFRAGTQQIENEVHKFWPGARTLRMDADTTRSKDSYEKILSSFANEEADILIGTQMIVKGHDFPSVTLVGVLAADMSLYAADYRAAERTFQLLTQAAGRAGRGQLPGLVVIQSYQPDNYAIVSASGHDYESFYNEEIEYRRLMGYPPVGHMMAIGISSGDEEKGIAFANRLRAHLDRNRKDKTGSVLIGPTPAAISKINDIFRFVIYVKSSNYAILTSIKDLADEFVKEMQAAGQYRGYSVQFDFDPMNTF
ncbi:replication restart helicase PriA [Butyrivibrio sp. MC2013]|uniref:replication restart helicase PriA n=1 Tax=Butyrivibrio sp. MC2013 TaxID=1280686 RepID=UPI000409D122|nr:primosomal protein N' [Butyrivibrio sp. MC2013]